MRTDGLSAAGVAERIETSYRTVQRWLVEFELDDAALIRKALAADVTGRSGGGE